MSKIANSGSSGHSVLPAFSQGQSPSLDCSSNIFTSVIINRFSMSVSPSERLTPFEMDGDDVPHQTFPYFLYKELTD